MSDIDLSAAIDAAALVHLGIDADDQAEPLDVHYAKKHVQPLVEAVLPLIEAAVREQIARDIEAQFNPLPPDNAFIAGEIEARREAARIARGDS